MFQLPSKVLRAWSQDWILRVGEKKAESYLTLYDKIPHASTSREARAIGAMLQTAPCRHHITPGLETPSYTEQLCAGARLPHSRALHPSCFLQSNRRDKHTPENKRDCQVNLDFNKTLSVTFRIICNSSPPYKTLEIFKSLSPRGYFCKPNGTYQFFPRFSLSLVRCWKDCPYKQACPGECQQGCRSTALTVVTNRRRR